MTANPLTSYLLGASLLIEYTVTIVASAIHLSDPALQERNIKRAASALQFFLGILDPSVDEENKQLGIFQRYYDALHDPALAAKIIQDLPAQSHSRIINPKVADLTAAQQVLSLPDTLNSIFAQIPVLTKTDRDTLCHAALTSHAFRNAAQPRLWTRPRDLNNILQQVRFAFGAAISGGNGDDLGHHVKRLRIRIFMGEWNVRLVEKIVGLTPSVVDLTLHWGDIDDGTGRPATPDMIAWVHKILSSLPNLTRLTLTKFAHTPESEDSSELEFPADAHLPFTKLKYLKLYDFHWYWEPMARGLGSALKELDIGFGTVITSNQIVDLSVRLTSLTTLRVESRIGIRHIQSLIQNLPNLERIAVTEFGKAEDEYVETVIPLFAGIKRLKELFFNQAIGPAELDILADSLCPLEEISLRLEPDDGIDDALENLLKKKRQTLKIVWLSFESNEYTLVPSDELVETLADIPHLERIVTNFDFTSHEISSSSIDKLLMQCPNLKWTADLDDLATGNSLYEKEYRRRLERERGEEDNEREENYLGDYQYCLGSVTWPLV